MATPIVWADVTALAPELSSLSTAAQTAILAYVNVAFDESMFKADDSSGVSSSLKTARVYLAAHLGTMTRLQGMAVAGPLIEESDGRLMRKFAVVTAANTSFSGTSYGDLLTWMINTSRARYPMVLR